MKRYTRMLIARDTAHPFFCGYFKNCGKLIGGFDEKALRLAASKRGGGGVLCRSCGLWSCAKCRTPKHVRDRPRHGQAVRDGRHPAVPEVQRGDREERRLPSHELPVLRQPLVVEEDWRACAVPWLWPSRRRRLVMTVEASKPTRLGRQDNEDPGARAHKHRLSTPVCSSDRSRRVARVALRNVRHPPITRY